MHLASGSLPGVPSGAVPFAHGIGGAKDLPVSPELAIAGAMAAVVVSFTVLAVAWREPRYDAATSGRPAPAWLARAVDSPAWTATWRTLGVLLTLYTAMAAILGKDLLTNPFFGIFYVWWWVGLVPLSLLFGPVWKAISPGRTINAAFAKLSGSDPDRGLYAYPERLGYWPAAVGLFAFVWMELVYPHSTELGPVRLWCAAYLAIMLIGGALFGSRFYASADPFEVYSSLVARLSVWGRRHAPDGRTDARRPGTRQPDARAADDPATGDRGQLVIRSPLANLDTVPVRPGLVAVVAVLFGSTAFDSFKDSTPWVTFAQDSSVPGFVLDNLGLLGFCVVVGLVFSLGCVLTGLGDDLRHRQLPNLFAHSVVPIIVGYIIAHYLTYLVEVGQQTLIQASDPFSTGANWFGTANLSVSYWLSYHPTFLADVKVLSVVLGHVVGVIAAHDRAVRILPRRHQLTGQLPLLFAMVAFTGGGLYLLFAA